MGLDVVESLTRQAKFDGRMDSQSFLGQLQNALKSGAGKSGPSWICETPHHGIEGEGDATALVLPSSYVLIVAALFAGADGSECLCHQGCCGQIPHWVSAEWWDASQLDAG
jgi:uncharacterized protein YidB (DUF937 family)